jgi:hypothetical protein
MMHCVRFIPGKDWYRIIAQLHSRTKTLLTLLSRKIEGSGKPEKSKVKILRPGHHSACSDS